MAGNLTAMIASIFSGSAVTADPYYEYTTLLLPGNGTNGAQNNTFLDASTNNFTITRNGNTTQGTFSPFSQTGWGNYFDGNGDYLATPTGQTPLTLNTDDFTLECWYYMPTQVQTGTVLASSSNSSSITNALLIQLNPTGNVWQLYINGTDLLASASNKALTLNTWQHFAVTRSGNTFAVYINGVAATGVATSSASISVANWLIGYWYLASHAFTGYISNFRLVKGTVVYTSNFTPPTAPLTAISGTSLLTCQSNRFIDNSSNTFAITVNGNTSVQAFSPFNPTSSWSSTTNGGSGYFDGNTDYLSVADNSNLRFGTNAFTIQGWIYRNASGAAHSIIAKGGASTGFVLQVTSTNILRFTHGTTNVDTTTTIPASAWTHIAAVRTNTSTNGFQLYINGVSSATATVSTDFNQTDTLYTGADRSAANVMNGYISGLKYTNGTAESISVPTEPPTSTTNVVLLLNFTNAGIYDATSKNDLETVGNAQISTAISAKWGSGSMAFDGTGGYLVTDNSDSIIGFGSGDWTIEFWLRLNSTGTQVILDGRRSSSGNVAPLIYYLSGLKYYTAGGDRISGGTLSTGQWYYISVVKSSGSTRMYIDGSQTGSTYTDGNTYVQQSQRPVIGAEGFSLGSNPLNGYLQDLRITKGYARPTTTPTAAFPTL